MNLNDLRYTANEVNAVADLFDEGDAKIWIDQRNLKSLLRDASEKGQLGGVRFLHFATHAVLLITSSSVADGA